MVLLIVTIALGLMLAIKDKRNLAEIIQQILRK
jgi:hypothetical protein